MSIGDRIMDNYLLNNPEADEAQLADAEYSWRIKLTKQILDVTETAMRLEGIPEEVMVRVLNTVVYGTAEIPEDITIIEQYRQVMLDSELQYRWWRE